MSELHPQPPALPPAAPSPRRWPLSHIATLFGFWLAIYWAALSTPVLLDDADSTHAQAVQSMAATGNWVTLHVDGIRYLEKPPLPYWLSAISLRIFGANTFAIHLPLALAVLALALLGYQWARRAFDPRTALYTGLFTLTSVGVFLFTRIFIPEVLLSLFLCTALYAALRALDDNSPRHAYAFWILMALAVLAKGLVAIVFLLATVFIYAFLVKQRNRLGRLKLFRGFLLFLLIAAPWHILAGLRNTGGANGHGFFWFYFINEHVLRFLGRRIPRDYNKLPAALYWTQHIIWLFPWSLFAPAALWVGYRKRLEQQSAREQDETGERLSRRELITRGAPKQPIIASTFTSRTILLLLVFSAVVVVFFSFSTNQEYYTFPVYLPLLMLLAAPLVIYERAPRTTRILQGCITFAHAAYTLLGLAIAGTLTYSLWKSRFLPASSDIGALLAHRDVGGYTLSTSHFFDLTSRSLATLRLPAILAAAAFAIGPAIAWFLRSRRKHLASTLTIAVTSAIFLIAAHIALVRFAPMLSSQNFAARIQQLEHNGSITGPDEVLIFGDQAFGSSIPFYLNRRVLLVDGRTTSMMFGSTFRDAPPIFLTHQQLLASWGNGPRKILFVPLGRRNQVDQLLANHPQFLLDETSGKALITDRPLNTPETP
jgi:4-amino-4-deoxy-L-arabinose transferase-like glycosyltransferase